MRYVLSAALILLSSSSALAQSWPVKPIRVISAVTPGNSGDTALRMAIPHVQTALGQPVVVENRTGAGGQIATLAVKSSAPDGYNVLLIAPTFWVTPLMLKQPPYDPVRDFSAITKLIDVPSLFAVSSAIKANTLKEFIDYAKRNPGKLAYGSNGIGTFFHLMGEAFSVDAGVKMLHVPYGTGSVAVPITDLANDRIQLYFPSYTSFLPVLDNPGVKVLAILDRVRLNRMPEVPTMLELMPGYTHLASFFGLVGPANLPGSISGRIQAEVRKALQDPAISAKLDAFGSHPSGNAPDAFAEDIRTAFQNYGKAMKAAGIEQQ
jgi:tripartite-type tricarboxylate transporter receptor subunit TctC